MQQDELDFLEKCRALNEQMKGMQDSREPITEDRVLSCIVLVRQLKLIGLGDAFWYLTALNGINAYATEKGGDDFDNFYKDYFSVLAKFLKKQESELVRMEIQGEGNSPTIYYEIAEVQFSFKNFAITNDLKDLVAEDLDQPKIAWDGIRKKNCVETLYNFGDANKWESNGLTMEDTEVRALIAQELEAFHAGTKTLRDVAGVKAKPARGSADEENPFTKEEKPTANAVLDAKQYPFRNQPINVFYGGVVRDLLREIKDRSLVPFLVKTYENGYGYNLHLSGIYSWKYQLDTLADELVKTEVSKDAGALLLFVHNTEVDYFILLITGKDIEGNVQLYAIQLLPWVKTRLQKDPSVVEYQMPTIDFDFESIHPLLIMAAFRSYLLKGAFDAEYCGSLRFCCYLFDCGKTAETDIVTDCPENYKKLGSVIYADETGRIAEQAREALKGTGGLEVVNTIISGLGKNMDELTGDYLPDVQFVWNQLSKSLKCERYGFSIIHERSAGKGHATASEFCQQLQKEGYSCMRISRKEEMETIPRGTSILIYDDYIPEEVDYSKAGYQIMFYDSYTKTEDEIRHVDYLLERAGETGGSHYYGVSTCRIFCDLGGGNSWLINNFALGLVQQQLWDPSYYNISVVDDPSAFSGGEGIAAVTVPREIVYDPEENTVISTRSQQMALYLSLCEGSKGVELYIEDAKLREHIKEKIKSYAHSYHWVAQYQLVETDNEKALEVREDITSDSSIHFKVEAAAIKDLGASAYEKLSEDSKNWLLSALLSYYDMRNVSQAMDYTGVVLMVCKCYEEELRIRMAEKYVDWSRKTYGDDYLNHLTKELQNEDGTGLIDYKDLSIGSYPYIMGYYSDGGVHNQKDKEEFQKYAEELLLVDPAHAESTIRSFVTIITHVRTHYRNKAAHVETIDVVLATDCLEYCVTEERTLGVMLDACKY